MTTIVTGEIQARDYFIERVEAQGWTFLPVNAANAAPELSALIDAVVDEMQQAQDAATAEAIVREFGDKYGDEPSVVSVPEWEVSGHARLYGSQGLTLNQVVEDEDVDWDTFTPDGSEWTPEAERLFGIFTAAVVAHRESCTDEDCECRIEVTR